MGSLLMHASILSTHVSSFLWDFCIFFFFSLFTLLPFLSILLSFCLLFLLLSLLTVHTYGLLYYLS